MIGRPEIWGGCNAVRHIRFGVVDQKWWMQPSSWKRYYRTGIEHIRTVICKILLDYLRFYSFCFSEIHCHSSGDSPSTIILLVDGRGCKSGPFDQTNRITRLPPLIQSNRLIQLTVHRIAICRWASRFTWLKLSFLSNSWLIICVGFDLTKVLMKRHFIIHLFNGF